MIENFEELELTFFAITETWFRRCGETDLAIADIDSAKEIKIIRKDRASRGGGVALAFNSRTSNFTEKRIPGNNYEILICEGRVYNMKRKVCVITVYIPPKTTKQEMEGINEFVADAIEDLKLTLEDPVFFIMGDTKKKDFASAFDDFPDIVLLPCPPTRAEAFLDQIFTNVPEAFQKNPIALPTL